MKCEFKSVEYLQKSGAPSYIRGSAFKAEDLMRVYHFKEFDKVVTPQEQVENLKIMQNEDGGWVAFVCGMPEVIRLFAYSFMHFYYEKQDARYLHWHFITSARWDKFLDFNEKKEAPPRSELIVLDSLLTHPPQNEHSIRSYDAARIGKISDITARYRGRSSILILCPDLEPDDAYKISLVQPEFIMNLRHAKKKDIEL